MELANLKLHDIDLDKETVFIREGKGKKDRVVPIGQRACVWLRKYVDETRQKLIMPPDEEFLTQVYTQVSIKKLKEVHTRTHPAKLKRTQTIDQMNTATEEALMTMLDEELEVESRME